MSAQQEKAKLAALEKKRKEMLDGFASQKAELAADTARNRTGADRFTSKTDGVDEQLKKSTYGLVQLADFRETREKLEERARRDAAGTSELQEEVKKPKKKKKENKVKLSFNMAEEAEDGESESFSNKKFSNENAKISSDANDENLEESGYRPSKRVKVGKNPTVDTHFLPDREREESERKVRDELRREWLARQEELKNEEIEITYSYWDGTGHRKLVSCKKGDSIAQFLEKCRNQFSELRAVSVDNLMYIKEDLIIPHHYTFYDFIVNRYRGKSGPMFSFDVHEDIRLIADASVEKDESHAGKVVERSWYNRSKHIFPASRWEVFNPSVQRDRYTIHGA